VSGGVESAMGWVVNPLPSWRERVRATYFLTAVAGLAAATGGSEAAGGAGGPVWVLSQASANQERRV